MAERSWTPRVFALAAAVPLVVAACAQPGVTRPSPAPPTAAAWRQVLLPGSASVTTLAADGGVLLVGASTRTAASATPGGSATPDAASRPLLFRVEGDAVAALPVVPASPYGAEASLLGIAAGGSGLTAIGGVRGGAHGNVRWTVWGSPRPSTGSGSSAAGSGSGAGGSGSGATPAGRDVASGLVERPQTFETFGGWDAGQLVGVVDGPDGPVIVGSWRGSVGLDIALWTPKADLWTRVPAASDLASDAQVLRTASEVAATASGLVIVGNEVDLGRQATQSPIAWTAPTASGPWRRIALPGGPGRAASVGCDAASCLIVGLGPDAAARAWRLAGTSATPVELPALTLDDPATVPPPAIDGAAAWAALPVAGRTALVQVLASGARRLVAPDGAPVGIALNAGGGAYVAVREPSGGSTLWRLEP